MKPTNEIVSISQLKKLIETNKKERVKKINKIYIIYYPY